jgi:putative oxidoreductase
MNHKSAVQPAMSVSSDMACDFEFSDLSRGAESVKGHLCRHLPQRRRRAIAAITPQKKREPIPGSGTWEKDQVRQHFAIFTTSAQQDSYDTIHMKLAANIAGIILGLLFISGPVMILLNVGPKPPEPVPGSPADWYMKAMMPTGYLTFVIVMELLGGILVAIPRTRNFGLLVLGPIIVNILAYHGFIMKGEGLTAPPVILVSVLAAFLLWCGREKFAGLRN